MSNTDERKKDPFRKIIYQSDVLEKVIEDAKTFATADEPILLYGETGTGKMLFAKAIHEYSKQSNTRTGEFVFQNLTGLQDNTLLLDDLFGHQKGAFTDAKRLRNGLIKQADGGTFFMDEIHSLQYEIKLCTLLNTIIENKTVRIGGSDREEPVDVRFIFGTNVELWDLVEQGLFNDDLYYRLGFKIQIPPLRQRGREDIVALIHNFISRFNTEYHRNIRIDEKALEKLTAYSWPGNVRQLKKCINESCQTASQTKEAENYISLAIINPIFEKDLFIRQEKIVTRPISSSYSADIKEADHQETAGDKESEEEAFTERKVSELKSMLAAEIKKKMNIDSATIMKTLDAYEGVLDEAYPRDSQLNIKNRSIYYGYWYYKIKNNGKIKYDVLENKFKLNRESVPNYAYQFKNRILKEKWFSKLEDALNHYYIPESSLPSEPEVAAGPEQEPALTEQEPIAPPEQEEPAPTKPEKPVGRLLIPAAACIAALGILITWIILQRMDTSGDTVVPLIKDKIVALAVRDERYLVEELSMLQSDKEIVGRRAGALKLLTLERTDGKGMRVTDHINGSIREINTENSEYIVRGSGFSRADDRTKLGKIVFYYQGEDKPEIPPVYLPSVPTELSKEEGDRLFTEVPEARPFYTIGEKGYRMANGIDKNAVERLFSLKPAYKYRSTYFQRKIAFTSELAQLEIGLESGNWGVVLQFVELLPFNQEID